MFAIFLNEIRVGNGYPSEWRKLCENIANQCHSGWLKRVTPKHKEVPQDELRFMPSLEENITIKTKVWKTKDSVIKFADKLGLRLEIIRAKPYILSNNAPFQRILPFDIYVYDLDTKSVIHCIKSYREDTYNNKLYR